MIRHGILFPLIFIVCQVLTQQYSQSQGVVWAASQELPPPKTEFPNINTPPPEDENSEQANEDESIIKEDDKPSLTEEKEKDLSTTVLSETKQNETKGLTSELKKLKDVEDPVKKLTMLSEIMEQKGKLPPKTTEALKSMLEGDTKAISELCNILSKDSSTSIAEMDCIVSPDQSNDTVIADIVEYDLTKILISLVDLISKSKD